MPDELRGNAPVPAATSGATKASAKGVSVTVDDSVGAPRYIAVVIRGVKVGESPEWLQERVASVGSRSISNVVDATNYVLHGLGQPVHAFDLAKLAGKAIIVRKAKTGEPLVTLDGSAHKLESWMTIIADGEHATALAGVMGVEGEPRSRRRRRTSCSKSRTSRRATCGRCARRWASRRTRATASVNAAWMRVRPAKSLRSPRSSSWRLLAERSNSFNRHRRVTGGGRACVAAAQARRAVARRCRSRGRDRAAARVDRVRSGAWRRPRL